MKKLIIETFIKGVVFSLGIILTILGVYGVNSLVNIKSVDTTTVLTSNLWNETMSSLTGAINTLGNEVVKLTGDQAISGKKTFLTPVTGVTPVANTDLVTKDYVDSKVGASSAGNNELQRTGIYNTGGSKNAIKLCRDLTYNGYSDWRLPTVEEANLFVNDGLNELILTRTPSGFGTTANYKYYLLDLTNGSHMAYDFNTYYVYMCVRG